MKQGRLGYNSSNGRYGLLSSDLWIDTGFHCGEGLEVLVDDNGSDKNGDESCKRMVSGGNTILWRSGICAGKNTGIKGLDWCRRPRTAGRKGTFDGRYGCRKCFCVTFDKSNKTAVSGERFLNIAMSGVNKNYVPYLALIQKRGEKIMMKRTISGMIGQVLWLITDERFCSRKCRSGQSTIEYLLPE